MDRWFTRCASWRRIRFIIRSLWGRRPAAGSRLLLTAEQHLISIRVCRRRKWERRVEMRGANDGSGHHLIIDVQHSPRSDLHSSNLNPIADRTGPNRPATTKNNTWITHTIGWNLLKRAFFLTAYGHPWSHHRHRPSFLFLFLFRETIFLRRILLPHFRIRLNVLHFFGTKNPLIDECSLLLVALFQVDCRIGNRLLFIFPTDS